LCHSIQILVVVRSFKNIILRNIHFFKGSLSAIVLRFACPAFVLSTLLGSLVSSDSVSPALTWMVEVTSSSFQVKAGLTESEETREPSEGVRTETEQANLKTMGERDPLKKLIFLKMIFLKELTTTRI
jgi:hypothetical protein